MLHRVVEKSETQYLLNSLYIQDYSVLIQSVTDERLQCVRIKWIPLYTVSLMTKLEDLTKLEDTTKQEDFMQ